MAMAGTRVSRRTEQDWGAGWPDALAGRDGDGGRDVLWPCLLIPPLVEWGAHMLTERSGACWQVRLDGGPWRGLVCRGSHAEGVVSLRLGSTDPDIRQQLVLVLPAWQALVTEACGRPVVMALDDDVAR